MMTHVMTRHIRLSCASILILLLFTTVSLADPWTGPWTTNVIEGYAGYEGSLKWTADPTTGLEAADSEIHATGDWANTTTELSYTVTRDFSGGVLSGPWTYSYTWYAPGTQGKDLSHFILQVSNDDQSASGGLPPFDQEYPDFFNSNVLPSETEDPTLYTSGPSNPGLADAIYGIKFQGSGTSWNLTFDSLRNPMEGSFYAVDGKGSEVYAYNSGLGTGDDFIPVPNASYVPVPGAALLGMLGLSYAGIKLRKWS